MWPHFQIHQRRSSIFTVPDGVITAAACYCAHITVLPNETKGTPVSSDCWAMEQRSGTGALHESRGRQRPCIF